MANLNFGIFEPVLMLTEWMTHYSNAHIVCGWSRHGTDATFVEWERRAGVLSLAPLSPLQATVKQLSDCD